MSEYFCSGLYYRLLSAQAGSSVALSSMINFPYLILGNNFILLLRACGVTCLFPFNFAPELSRKKSGNHYRHTVTLCIKSKQFTSKKNLRLWKSIRVSHRFRFPLSIFIFPFTQIKKENGRFWLQFSQNFSIIFVEFRVFRVGFLCLPHGGRPFRAPGPLKSGAVSSSAYGVIFLNKRSKLSIVVQFIELRSLSPRIFFSNYLIMDSRMRFKIPMLRSPFLNTTNVL